MTHSGVSQGLQLRCVLFSLLVNDIDSACVHFADNWDDLEICCCIRDQRDYDFLQNSMVYLQNWLKDNELPTHIEINSIQFIKKDIVRMLLSCWIISWILLNLIVAKLGHQQHIAL